MTEAAQRWFVNTGGKIFGPYSLEQMVSFAREGRVRAVSVVRHGDTGEWMQAAVEPQLGRLFDTETALAPPPPVKPLERPADTGPANVLVVGQFRSRSPDPFEKALHGFGEVIALTHTAWLVRTKHAIGVMRNDLVKFLGADDRLFMMDGKRGKTTWSNFGPTDEARLRSFVAASRHDAEHR